MAYYAALVSLVQLLEDIIHRDRYPNFLVDKQKMASLHEKFSLLQVSLDDYYSHKDEEAADFLERRIRDAAYQAQDIIESQISNQINPQQPEDLERVDKEVDSIVEEVMRFKKSHTTADNLELNYIYSADTAEASKQASNGGSTMVGFDEPLTTMKDQLCGGSSKLQVVSIVGMGGIGKTTLAKNLFDDKLTVYHFYCRAWVTVSQDYHLEKILLDIFNSLKLRGVGELEEQIYKYLKGRRYLIIIDDIWDTEVWDDLKRIFPDDSNGSRIILTTRVSDVAVYADRFGFLHQMQFLNDDQSWNLFCQKVFCPPELKDIGKLIANSCRGLPLAIVVVAGLLSKINKTRYDWEEIARNVSSIATKNDEHFSKIFFLSYNHLPHHLKSCFLYIGGFPEDYEIRVFKLIKLWVAEGFINPIKSKSLEEVAEEYLKELVNRNLLLVTKKRLDGKFNCCSIHDILRELCMERVRHENFLCILDERKYLYPEILRKVHHLYIHPSCSTFGEVKKRGSCLSNIHSIICFSRHVGEILSFAMGSKLLRVLDLPYIRFRSFPDEILELFHLRYLAVFVDDVGMLDLPPSISKLQNLQTLTVSPRALYGKIVNIPLLFHLRHVNFGSLKLSPIPFAKLENLQTLSTVVNVTFTNEVIEMIPNLRKVKVSYIYPEYDTWDKWQKLGLNNLVNLGQLETLEIWFGCYGPKDVASFPDSFAFPQNLKKLTLMSCALSWKDMRVVGSLPNLEILKLRQDSFTGEEWEPIEGDFLQLKFLEMETLDLNYWRAERNHFPKLQHLKIIFCWRLQDIPPEIGEITTLELIEVRDSRLAAGSALKIQEEQRDLGNDVLQVRVSYNEWFLEREAHFSKLQEEQEKQEALESNKEVQEEEALESRRSYRNNSV